MQFRKFLSESEGCEDHEEMDLMKAADTLQSHYDKRNLNLVKCLLTRFPDSYMKPEWRTLPIHFFAEKGQLDVVQFLMAMIKNKEPEDLLGQKPIHYAARSGRIKVIN